jgi:DNA-binding CsgD family transcriptional regulator/PAS domain-containing protein
MISPRALSDLIQLLYAAVEDPEVWPRFLELAAEAVGAGMTVLLAAPRDGRGVTISSSVRADPAALETYAASFAAQDIYATSGHPSVTQQGALVHSEQMVPRRELVATPYYNEFMRRFDLFHSVVATLLADEKTSAGLAFHYPRRAPIPDAERMELISLLIPHLTQALRIHRRWAELEEAEHAATAAIEQSTTAYFFLDGRGTILRANRRAEEVLRAGDGLVSRGGRLAARLPDDDRALQKALGSAATTSLAGGTLPGCTMPVRRGISSPPYVVALMPVSAVGRMFQRHGAAVLALVSDPAWEPDLSSRRLQRVFGWTEAEAEVAREIVEGTSLRDVAERRGVGIETVRTQLKSVFRKAGVSSQAGLVRLVANAAVSLQSRRS